MAARGTVFCPLARQFIRTAEYWLNPGKNPDMTEKLLTRTYSINSIQKTKFWFCQEQAHTNTSLHAG